MKHYFKKVLSALALAFVVIVATGAVKASAAALTYDEMADAVQATDGKCVVYVLKSKEATTIKASAKYIEFDANEVKLLSEMGIKDGTAVYFYIAAAALEEDLEVKANFTLDAPAAYKAVGKIDYTQADVATSTAVLSATVTDKEKKEIANATIIWKGEDDEVYVDNDKSTVFTGSKLAAMLENGGTITIKVKGNGTTRTSKAFKVKIAKQAKLPSVKLDVKKNTFSIKNGFDFAKATKNGEEYSIAATDVWYTVLPYLKDAKTKLEAASIVATTSYLPLAKKDTNATAVLEAGAKVAYTSYKFKALRLDTLINTLNKEVTDEAKKVKLSADFNVAVRKSATEKKPASQVAYFDIAAQKGAPQMYTVANISTCTTIATADELKFKATEIVNNTSAWAGIGEDVAPTDTAVVDDSAKKYEMAVVKAADYEAGNIDWSTVSWKSFKKGTSISDKTKTKYYVVGATNPTEAVLKAGTKGATTDEPYGDAATVILIRRAGVKGKTISESVLASELLVTYVYKDTNKKYNWEIAKTTTGQVLVGGKGYAYSLTVNTWQKQSDGTYAYGATETKLEGYKPYADSQTITLPLEENQVYVSGTGTISTGFAVGDDGKTVTITKPDAEGKMVSGTVNIATKVTVTIKYEGDVIAPDQITGKYLGTAIAYSTYVGEKPGKDGKTTYTVELPASIKGCNIDTTEKTITVNEGSEVEIVLKCTEKASTD